MSAHTTTLAPTQRRQRPPAFRNRGARLRCDECGGLFGVVAVLSFARGFDLFERSACLGCVACLRAEEAEGGDLYGAWGVEVRGIYVRDASFRWTRMEAA